MSMGLILTVGEIKFGRLLGQLPILFLGVLFAVPAKAEISQRIDAEENEMTASRVRMFNNPRNVIKMDAGPSWIVSEVQTPRTIYKSRFGVGLGIDYQHLWRKCIGVGVNYMFYSTSFNHNPIVEDINMRMHYIGPSFVGSWRLGRKWRADSSFGVGFSCCIWTDNVIEWHRVDELETEYNIGILGQMGIEYMLSKTVGIGMQYQGFFMPLKEPANYKGDYDLYGIKRIDAKIGIRFYL